MAFSANNRVRVSSQSSAFREKLGTVVTAAADSLDGFNKVRIDGHAENATQNFSDRELQLTNFPDPTVRT